MTAKKKNIFEKSIPTSSRQAFAILDNILSEEDKLYVVGKSCSEFTTEAHFSLGLWIRNNWVYPMNEEDSDDECTRRLKRGCLRMLLGERGVDDGTPILFGHPDDLSDNLLRRYYAHLKRVYRKDGFAATDE
ncbi:MAG: hypothetical protein IKS22_07205 [Bacteroidales bacterium]|nr:hypothetical protein [Bacteroidales bacterium]